MRYLSLEAGAAMSRISVKRSMSTLEELETVEAILAVRRTVGCVVDGGAAIVVV